MKENTQGYKFNPCGFVKAENSILYNDKLADKAKILYFHICNRYSFFLNMNKKQMSTINEFNIYFESQASMAQAIGYSVNSTSKVSKLITQLIQYGYLKSEPKANSLNSKWYTPLDPNNTDKVFNATQEKKKHKHVGIQSNEDDINSFIDLNDTEQALF